jgi:hypothetical protein
MATQELIKSIEAKKLNKRSKLPLPEPPVTIPYGGLVQDLETDGGMIRFTYLGEMYHCPEDRLMSALSSGAKSKETAAPLAAQGASVTAVVKESAVVPSEAPFHWQEVPTSQNPFWRAKVPGGWLLLGSTASARAVTFYPDPQHAWDGTTLD